MASLNPYGKVQEADHEKLLRRRKTIKRVAIIAISSIVLVAVVVAAVFGATRGDKGGKSGGSDGAGGTSASIKAVCGLTLYPDSCTTSLGPLAISNNIEPEDIYKLSVQVAMNQLSLASDEFFKNDAVKNAKDPKTIKALESCHELLSLSLDHLNNSISIEDKSFLEAFGDLRTWLSSAGTYQQTCIDQFDNVTHAFSTLANDHLRLPSQYTSNSLAIISSIEESMDTINAIKRRRLMSSFGDDDDDEAPEWLSYTDRKLLQKKSSSKIKFDAIVARDGSGDFKTIKAALKTVPEKSDQRFIIYVKKGVYKERVRIEKTMWNVMIIGDGMDATTVVGSRNFIDGTPTFQSATFAVFGKGFIARDIGFRNAAGAAKHQAVALMSTADLSVFYRCKMDAFQDTLYPHSNRQFYRECTILGTVDFIFGNSAVVLQNCNILPRKPMKGQQNTITAQGRFDPNQNTGISIQNCTIKPFGNLTGINNFLGRPWKNHSTTVFMQNNMDGFIHPNGWMPWVGTSAPNTIFYAEYQNIGRGAATKNRVKWKGLKLKLSAKEASRYTVKPFINGDKWLKGAGIPFKAGL